MISFLTSGRGEHRPTRVGRRTMTTAQYGNSPSIAEVALQAAIELDRLQTQPDLDTVWLDKLATTLRDGSITMLPLYDRALMSVAGERPANKRDLFAKLLAVADDMTTAESGDVNVNRLRDFCLALHEAVLNQEFQRHSSTIAVSRRYA